MCAHHISQAFRFQPQYIICLYLLMLIFKGLCDMRAYHKICRKIIRCVCMHKKHRVNFTPYSFREVWHILFNPRFWKDACVLSIQATMHWPIICQMTIKSWQTVAYSLYMYLLTHFFFSKKNPGSSIFMSHLYLIYFIS